MYKIFDNINKKLGFANGADVIVQDDVNVRRRNVLKWVALGGGAFVLGKIFGPSINLFPKSASLDKTQVFANFRVVENDQELGFYDSLGNQILILEKDPRAGE